VFPARGKVLVDTDISMAVPAGTCALPYISALDSNTDCIYLLYRWAYSALLSPPLFSSLLSLALSLSLSLSLSSPLSSPLSSLPPPSLSLLSPRSGLASKHFIATGAGVIDADYRGQVKVLLFNHSEKDFEVKEGDRVAQLVLERIYTPDVVEVQELEESVRGAGGFGSTG
jgi:hypothetical protein